MLGTLAAVFGVAILVGGAFLLVRGVPGDKFVEYRMDQAAGCADRNCGGY